jgi:hypothetical protein
LDKDKIQILQLRGVTGALGYRMGAMGEWRTGSGEAVVVQGVVEAGRLKPVAGDIWAVDVEGLKMEEDIMWSGEGKSWMVTGEIGPERLVLLSAGTEKEVDMLVAPGEHCMGHTAEEVNGVVSAVGDKWEAAFKLWRAEEPDSDVPRCRTLLGQPGWGDGWPPLAVRSLVGLDDAGNPTGLANWVHEPHELLGAGADRFAVALCSDHVLKVDPYWRTATENEVEIWKGASEKTRALLCPVLASGEEGLYGWLVMPRCQAMGEVDEKTRVEIAEVLGLGDVSDYNLGLLDGKVVILDYGTYDESGPVVHKSEADAMRLGEMSEAAV